MNIVETIEQRMAIEYEKLLFLLKKTEEQTENIQKLEANLECENYE